MAPAPTAASDPTSRSAASRALEWAIALLVAAQAAVVGLQVVGRHLLRSPLPWTEEIARLLLVWLMCVGGIRALQESAHPRVTALVRLLTPPGRAAVDRGLQMVLLAFFLCLMVPAWRLTVSSAAERLPASGLSGGAISLMLPVALVLMSAALAQQLRDGGGREAPPLAWSLRAAGLALPSVVVPLLAGAPPPPLLAPA